MKVQNILRQTVFVKTKKSIEYNVSLKIVTLTFSISIPMSFDCSKHP